ncbi:signal peptidase II [Thalassotalea euphylliae]|uniref:Lipoprotein signal peptidase n=1 Tax=Thalassotalea euphylliae TaxID=1655234 RepID=A0A3E0UG79_9GAMM|nr:signal peptidase II [Thalassotalea euphylliae]REL34762.1 lipoprotein signal peptidase [Thalassotalea euphylliae]
MSFSSSSPFSSTGLKWLWLTVLFLIIDQVTKHWVAGTFDLYESVAVMPYFNLTYVHNEGAAFSFLADQGGWQRWFFTTIAALASGLFIYWLSKTPSSNRVLGVGFALMLSGALGNLIDRVLFGYVIDFLDFYVGKSHWPAFNVADSVIFVGAALMIYDSFFGQPDKES